MTIIILNEFYNYWPFLFWTRFSKHMTSINVFFSKSQVLTFTATCYKLHRQKPHLLNSSNFSDIRLTDCVRSASYLLPLICRDLL